MPETNFCDSTSQSFSSESMSTSLPNSGVGSPSVDTMTKSCHCIDCDLSHNDESSLKTNLQLPKNSNLNDTWSIPLSEDNSETLSTSSSSNNLTEVLKNLTLILEDVSELYPEVKELSLKLDEIEKVLKVRFNLPNINHQ